MSENFNRIVNQPQPVLVDFYAPWCGPCKMMNPILSQLKDTFKDRIRIVKINIDNPQNARAVKSFQVQGVPTLVLFKDGHRLWRESGVIELSRLIDKLEKFIPNQTENAPSGKGFKAKNG